MANLGLQLDRRAARTDLGSMFGELYHNRVLELAADIPHAGRLADADASSLKVSRVCGSTVLVFVMVDEEGKVAAIAVDPKACALGQAATSILAREAVGKSLEELAAAREVLRAMLKGEGAPPAQGDPFWELRHLAPVKDYPPRHASTMLAFDAAVAAVEEALATKA